MWRYVVGILVVAVFLPQPAYAQVQPTERFQCELTTANGVYPSDSPFRSPAMYGNEAIAIGLGAEGRTIVLEPGTLGKFLWAKARLPMTIEGRRLDAPAPPLRPRITANYEGENYQPSALFFPTSGCWEITSRVGASSLTFMVKVLKVTTHAVDPLVRWLSTEERMRAMRRMAIEDLGLPSMPW